ncbi:hypothetical protein EB093_00990 [bacterium]|nr:hypothetical protein [bacterium]
MTTTTEKILYCIHGMISITCNLCKDKTEEKITEEHNFVKEDRSKSLMYDYQDIELPNAENIEDLDFDMDDMSS